MSDWDERISKVGEMSELISNFSAMNAHDASARHMTPLVERNESAVVVERGEAVA